MISVLFQLFETGNLLNERTGGRRTVTYNNEVVGRYAAAAVEQIEYVWRIL